MAPDQIGPNLSEGSSSLLRADKRRGRSYFFLIGCTYTSRQIQGEFCILLPSGGAVNGWSPSYLEELVEAYYIIKSSFVLGCRGKKEVFNACCRRLSRLASEV